MDMFEYFGIHGDNTVIYGFGIFDVFDNANQFLKKHFIIFKHIFQKRRTHVFLMQLTLAQICKL